jgi:ketosteroid isomerase-like protein
VALRTRDWWLELCRVIDAKDAKGFVSYLTDDCEFRFANGPPVVGRAAVAAAVDGFWATIAGSRHTVDHCWGDEHSAVCAGTCTYTRRDGSTVTLPFVDVLYFRGEQAERYYIYLDIAPVYHQ